MCTGCWVAQEVRENDRDSFRVQCPSEALHLSELERTLRETEAEIDRRVYDLYGLSEEERQVVEKGVT